MRGRDIIQRFKAAEKAAGKMQIFPESVLHTVGELTLDNYDNYVIELFSYKDRYSTPPALEHFREVFEDREQAIAFIEQLNECDMPRIYRQITVHDMTATPPHYEIRWNVGY